MIKKTFIKDKKKPLKATNKPLKAPTNDDQWYYNIIQSLVNDGFYTPPFNTIKQIIPFSTESSKYIGVYPPSSAPQQSPVAKSTKNLTEKVVIDDVGTTTSIEQQANLLRGTNAQGEPDEANEYSRLDKIGTMIMALSGTLARLRGHGCGIEYNSTLPYEKGAFVSYNNKWYMSIYDGLNIGHLPTDTIYWQEHFIYDEITNILVPLIARVEYLENKIQHLTLADFDTGVVITSEDIAVPETEQEP